MHESKWSRCQVPVSPRPQGFHGTDPVCMCLRKKGERAVREGKATPGLSGVGLVLALQCLQRWRTSFTAEGKLPWLRTLVSNASGVQDPSLKQMGVSTAPWP